MAQRGLARAFRAIFGQRHSPDPPNLSDQPDLTPSEGSRYDTDGSSYEEEIQPNPPAPAPSTSSRPQDHSDLDPQDIPTPKLHIPRTNTPSYPSCAPVALRTSRDDAAPSADDDTPGSQISLRSRHHQAVGSVMEPRGVESSRGKAQRGATDAHKAAYVSGRKASQANALAAVTAQPLDAVKEPAHLAGPFLPAPSAGTNSAIAERPELVEVGELDDASLETMQRLCRKLGLERSGGKEKLRERIRAKLAQPRVLNEESMFIDADGNPHTPAKESWLAARRRPEESVKSSDDGAQGGDKRSYVTTTTVDRAKVDGADGEQDERTVGMSSDGMMAKSGGGEVAKSVDEVLAKPSGLLSKSGGSTTSKSGAFMTKSDGKPRGRYTEQEFEHLKTGRGRASNNIAMSATDPSKSRTENSALGKGMEPNNLNVTNGAGNLRDLRRSTGFAAPLLNNFVNVGDGVGRSVSRGRTSNANGGPSQSVDARGGALESVEMGKLLDDLGNKNRKLTPAEYESCLQASSGKVVARGERGAAALLVSKDGPVTSSYFGAGNQRHCAVSPDKGEVDKNHGVIEGKKEVQREVQKKNIEMQSVRQVLGATDSNMEADIALERNFSTSPLSKSDCKKQARLESNPASYSLTGDRDRDKRQKFTFNLNIVDKETGEEKSVRQNPFRGVFAGAAGGPSAHNTVGFSSNRAANRTPPTTDEADAKNNLGLLVDNDVPMTEQRKEAPNARDDDVEDQPLLQEQEYATPREILRSFNRFGPDVKVAGEDQQNIESLGPRRESDRGSSRDQVDRPRVTDILPKHLRGFSSMSRPSQGPRYSASITQNWGGTEGAAGLSSFRSRRPMSTASAGLYVNLRNSGLAPENKHIGERLQKRGSWTERSARPPLSSSSLRILQELKKVREENRALVSNKRTLSPMPVPPSVAKRIKRTGEFNKNAVRGGLTNQSDQEMRSHGKEMTESVKPVASVQSGGDSSAYPLTPLRPLPRLEATPVNTKKRKSIAFGSGKKRLKSTTFSDAAISEMKTLMEEERESDKSIQVAEKDSLGKSLELGSTSNNVGGNTLVTKSARTPPAPQFAIPPVSIRQDAYPALPEKIGDEPKSIKQSSTAPKTADFAAPNPSSVFSFNSRNDEEAPSLQRPGFSQMKSSSRKDDLSDLKSPPNAFAPDVSKGIEKRSLVPMFGSVSQAAPSIRVTSNFADSAPAASAGKETKQPGSEKDTVTGAVNFRDTNNTRATENFSKNPTASETQSEYLPESGKDTRNETGEALQRQSISRPNPSKGDKLNLVSEPAKTPVVLPGQLQTAAAGSVSAYDMFKSKEGTVARPDVGDSTSSAREPVTGAVGLSAPSVTPVFSFDARKGVSEPSTFNTLKDKVEGSNENKMKETSQEAETKMTGSNMPLAFGMHSEAPASSSATAASPGLAVFGGKGAPSFTFGASQTPTEKSTDVATAQGFTLSTSAAALTTAPSITTPTVKEATVGSLVSAPPSNSFLPPRDVAANAPEQLAEKPTFPLGNGKSTPQFGALVPPNANKDDDVKPSNPFARVATQGARTTAAEMAKPTAVFGTAVTSGATENSAATGIAFGSTTPKVEKSSGLQTGSAAPMSKNPFGVKSAPGNADAGDSGSGFKSSISLSETRIPAFGQPVSQGAAQSSSVISLTPQPLLSQSASAPGFLLGNTAGQAASTSQVPERFSFSAPARKFEKNLSGPFGGSQFESAFSQKPSGNMFVFGTNPSSQPPVTPGNGLNGPQASSSKVSASTFVFGANSSPQPPAVMGSGMNQAELGIGQPNPFGSSSQPTTNPFAAPVVAPVPVFGSTPAVPVTPAAPFGSMAQPPNTNVNPFVQSQAGLGGATSFGASQPGLLTNAALGIQPTFGPAAAATPQVPSFGGFGNATSNQPFGNMDSTMDVPQGNQSQFGAPLSSSLPTFGGGNPAGGGGFNIGMKQQPPVHRRNRRILRARRTNR